MTTNGNGNGHHEQHERQATMFPHIMELANIPGNEATFVVDATHMDSAAAFSPEAMDVLSTELLAFVVSRIMREWKSDDDAPHHLQVDIRVLVS